MCLKLDEQLPPRSALTSIAVSYCASLSVPCDLRQCDVLSLRSEICKKQKNLLMSALLAKPLHGQYFSFVNSDVVDTQNSFNWLRRHLHSETESTVLAVQDQVIATRVIEAKVMHKFIPSLMCRVCGTAEETIVHLLAACPILATTAYLHRHNLVAAVIHWHLMRFYSFQSCSRLWYSHKPSPVIESSSAKILWDFRLATSHNHPSSHPDIVLYDFRQQEIFFVEISCPADINVSIKEDEKINKYLSLATDFCWMYNMPVVIVPVVLGCAGVVSSCCLQFLRKIPGFTMKLFGQLQKAVLIGTSQVLRTIPLH